MKTTAQSHENSLSQTSCPGACPGYTPPVVEVVEVKVSRFCAWSYDGDIEDWEEIYF